MDIDSFRHPRPGDQISASEQEARNRLTRGLLNINPTSGWIDGTGQPLVQGGGRAASGAVKRFRVVSVDLDHIVCYEIGDDGIDGTDEIKVAKPYKLRVTPFDGMTIAGRTFSYPPGPGAAQIRKVSIVVNGEPASENQTIIQIYQPADGEYPGDEIYAVQTPDGGTGVVLDDGEVLEWLDLNIDGRHWSGY
jgi:hypothetical protein